MNEENEKKIEENEAREITTELRESYLQYAMSVIVGRALPDVRDGLKPVQRRILWAMWDSGLKAGAKSRKSANVVGEVLGRYHPHGDMAVYDAMVRLAQDFSMRYPLITGQGNFGSIDGDNAAAMRYTEAKLSKVAEELLEDIEKDTVEMVPNYDGVHREPRVLPSKLPHFLLNGAVGIAVGMATNVPPHNLREVLAASSHLIDNPEATTEELMEFIKGPDFPTGGGIYDRKAIIEAYATGRGKITVRGTAEVLEKQIVITEIPYQVNKSELIIRMAELVQEKKIEGIRDIRDESDKDGLRIVIDLKNDAVAQKILNQLYNSTRLQSDFHLNMIALVGGVKPQILSVKEALGAHIEHRREVVRRRAEFDLARTRERVHILEGLMVALNAIDEVIATIKKSKDKDEARVNLVRKFSLTPIQADAILEMRLHSLAALERARVEEELAEKKKLAAKLELLLGSEKEMRELIKREFAELAEKYGDARRTRVVSAGLKEFREEDLVPDEEVMITLSKGGYIKRLPPQAIRSQHRGGKGIIGSDVGEEDFIRHFASASTHDNILFFTESGKVFQTKVYEIPAASRTAKGKTVHNFLEIPADESVSAIVAYPTKRAAAAANLVMVTREGVVKKTAIKEFENVRRSGIIAINLNKNDKLIGVKLSNGTDEVIITTKKAQAIRFKESNVRPMSRATAGVRGILLGEGDTVTSFDVVPAELGKTALLLSVMANGFAKQTKLSEYKVQQRGGRGIKTAQITPKTGALVASHVVSGELELVAISVKGQIIKTEVKSVRVTSRAAQGVRIMKLAANDTLAGVLCL